MISELIHGEHYSTEPGPEGVNVKLTKKGRHHLRHHIGGFLGAGSMISVGIPLEHFFSPYVGANVSSQPGIKSVTNSSTQDTTV